MRNNVFYLTNTGLEKMIKELDMLEAKKEYKLKHEFSILNRNKKLDPDYVVWSDELSFIKRRINEIRNILQNALLIVHRTKNSEVVELGAKVTLLDEKSKEEITLSIVDSPEINPAEGMISKNSPLGSAVLGRRMNERFFVGRPVNKNYLIKNVTYEDFDNRR